jgi:hypothetical protein
VSSSDYREPTNEELWPQPPASPAAGSQPGYPGQGLAPQQPVAAPVPAAPPSAGDRTPFVLALISMVMAVPLTAIAISQAGLPGLLVVWIGIVLVNAVYAWGRRR